MNQSLTNLLFYVSRNTFWIPTVRSRAPLTSEKASLESRGAIPLIVAHFFLNTRDTRILRESRLKRDCHLEQSTIKTNTCRQGGLKKKKSTEHFFTLPLDF